MPAFKIYKEQLLVLRICAASLVIVSHAYQIRDSFHFVDPLGAFTNTAVTMGNIGVYIFFILSGFLLSHSIQSDSNVRSYLSRRIARIFPALVIVVIGTILIGSLFSTGSFVSYFTSVSTYKYLDNITLYFATPTIAHVVLAHTPPILNASLWTLPFEFTCYIGLIVINTLALRSRSNRPFVFVAGVIFSLWILTTIAAPYAIGPRAGVVWVVVTLFKLGSFFTIGTLIDKYSSHLNHLLRFAPTMVIFLLLFILFHNSYAVTSITTLSVVIYFTALVLVCSPNLKLRLSKVGDPSYGMYLSGWFITEVLCVYLSNLFVIIAIALVGSLAYGYLSWHTVEKPVASKIRHLTQRRVVSNY